MHTILRKDGTNKPLIKITSESGKSITVTENHKLLVHTEDDYEWKEAKDLTEQDNLVEFD